MWIDDTLFYRVVLTVTLSILFSPWVRWALFHVCLGGSIRKKEDLLGAVYLKLKKMSAQYRT